MDVALTIISQEGVTWTHWSAIANACERFGVRTLLSADHYLSRSNELGNVAHDAWTVLAGLAARTSTLRLGTLVTPVTFRQPAVLANAVATADHISGGRIELGLGAGWMDRLVGTVDEVAQALRPSATAGADRVMIMHSLHTDLESIQLLGERLSPLLDGA